MSPATDGQVLIVTVLNWYGRETVVPQCELSRKFAALLGQKTLTPADCELIRGLGYEIRVKGTDERIL